MTVPQNMTMKTVKPVQVLELQPAAELRFQGPFTEEVTTDLHLFNTSDRRVCFKVKTNVPQQYCVQPSGALLEPKTQATVTIILQPQAGSRPQDSDQHKFMVQSIYAPEGHLDGLERLWKFTKKEDVMETKLKCFFTEQRPSSPIISDSEPAYRRHVGSLEKNGTSTHDRKNSTGGAVKPASSESSTGVILPLLIVAAVIAFAVYKFLC